MIAAEAGVTTERPVTASRPRSAFLKFIVASLRGKNGFAIRTLQITRQVNFSIFKQRLSRIGGSALAAVVTFSDIRSASACSANGLRTGGGRLREERRATGTVSPIQGLGSAFDS